MTGPRAGIMMNVSQMKFVVDYLVIFFANCPVEMSAYVPTILNVAG